MAGTFISVILPVHNGASGIEEAAHSILSQQDCTFELLVVDNASTDGTSGIVQKLAAADPRIRLLYESRKGISYALNMGLKHAKGDYIARMDADDVSLPHRLARQVAFLDENPDIGLVSGLVEFVGDKESSQGYVEYVSQLNRWKTEKDISRYRFVESPFVHPSVMFRKSLVDRYGFYSEADEPEDYELWLRWFARGVRMCKLDRYLIQWKDSPRRLSRSHENYAPAAFDRVRYRYLAQWLRLHRPERPIYVWGGGKLANRKMRLLEQISGIGMAGIIDLKEKRDSPLPHIRYTDIPPAGEIFIISMVSNRGKYAEIDRYLRERGYVYEKDFILA